MDLRDEGGTWKPGSYPRSNTESHGTGREKTMGTGTAGQHSGLGWGVGGSRSRRESGRQETRAGLDPAT